MLDQGASKNANLQEWDKLWSTNAKFIDSLCPRYCAVSKDKVAELYISNWKGPAFEVVSVPAHQKNP